MTIFNGVNEVLRGFAIVAVLAIAAVACGSSSTPESVAVTKTDSAVEPTALEEREPVEQETEAAIDSDASVVLTGTVMFDREPRVGDWTAAKGGGLLGCPSGAVSERLADDDQVALVFTCDAARSGSFMGVFTPPEQAGDATSAWDIIVGDDDFSDMSGSGIWTGILSANRDRSNFTIEFDADFGEVAVPVTTSDRLNQWTDRCLDGFVTTDGLTEYATVEHVMSRLDIRSGERTDHGPPPNGCAMWIGDEDLGRRVAISIKRSDQEPQTMWFGPYDGEWETEVVYDEFTVIINRSIAANRLLILQPFADRVFILDATTGDAIGSPFNGTFPTGRNSVATAVSDDGALIAIAGADVVSEAGLLLIIDAETGVEVAQIALEAPAAVAIFDDDEVLVGLTTGAIATVDIASLEISSTVAVGPRAPIASIGVRPDGLVVAVTNGGAFVVDRVQGPTGTEINLRHSVSSRVQPDGSVTSWTSTQLFEIYELEG